MHIHKHLQLLGIPVQDKVTNVKGVVTSICFDLYGCVQALVNPGQKADGTLAEQLWLDVGRLQRLSNRPVMQQPDYIAGRQAEGKQGAADKPVPSHA